MRSKKVKQILGIGIIVVIIAGVVFIFTRLNKPAEQEQAMQTAPKFLTEETVDNPTLLEEEEERTWEEVVSDDDLWLRTITDTYIFTEPFSDAKTIVKVPINTDIDELACCFQGKESMGWSKVSYNGKIGYVDMRDAEYIIEEEEEVAEVKDNEQAEGVSEDDQHSIVEVTKPDEKADETTKADSTEKSDKAEQTTQKEQTAQTTKPAEQPKPAEPAPTQPTETPNPNVTVKTESEKQAEINSDLMKQLEAAGGFRDIPQGTVGAGQGTGTKYGDLQ